MRFWSLFKYNRGSCALPFRHGSSIPLPSRRRQVFISESQSIFENLSVEDWLFTNSRLQQDQKLLLMWKNVPAVVIGKFQNQWKECNLHFLASESIHLARRKSGGGAVYHDLGNLNLSFVTHRQDYDRESNLTLVTEALRRKWPDLPLELNTRDDIIFKSKYKISGSAAKLTRNIAYHHFTLLINSNLTNLSQALSSPLIKRIQSTASESVPYPTENLSTDNPAITVDAVIDVLAEAFVQDTDDADIRRITADEDIFPGITAIQTELQSWDWVYGKTPKFSVSHTYENRNIVFEVEKGIIKTVQVLSESEEVIELTQHFTNLPFCPLTIKLVSEHLKKDNIEAYNAILSFLNKLN